MDFLFTVPTFLKVGIAFLGILVTNRAGIQLGWSIILFTTVLVLWVGAGMSGLLQLTFALTEPQTYLLTIVIINLLLFTEALNRTGRIKKTVEALQKVFSSRKLLLGGFPALVGLLPMPGGALFSAPLVASIDNTNTLTASHKAAINYWYRHIWEFWWPLYPGVILAISITGLSPAIFYLLMAPFTVFSVIVGYPFLLHRIISCKKKPTTTQSQHHAIAQTLGPIATLVLISVLAPLVLPETIVPKNIANLISMLIGLLFAQTIVFKKDRALFLPVAKILLSKRVLSLMLTIIGVQLFSAALRLPVLSSSDSTTIVTLMRDEFRDFGVPILLIIALLPLISGFVTGVAFAFVGASFPLIFELIGHNASFNYIAAITALCYVFGYAGMILSPVHICFVVTNEYFNAKLLSAYRFLIGPTLIILLASVLLSGFYFMVLK